MPQHTSTEALAAVCRKSKSRKARLSDKDSVENNPETLSLLPSRAEKGLEAEQPLLLALPETKARPRPRNHAAELDSAALQEHLESDSIERHEVRLPLIGQRCHFSYPE